MPTAAAPPTSRGRATRERIVTTADLMVRRGAATTSLDDVRVAASVSKGQLYHYFQQGRPRPGGRGVHDRRRPRRPAAARRPVDVAGDRRVVRRARSVPGRAPPPSAAARSAGWSASLPTTPPPPVRCSPRATTAGRSRCAAGSRRCARVAGCAPTPIRPGSRRRPSPRSRAGCSSRRHAATRTSYASRSTRRSRTCARSGPDRWCSGTRSGSGRRMQRRSVRTMAAETAALRARPDR